MVISFQEVVAHLDDPPAGRKEAYTNQIASMTKGRGAGGTQQASANSPSTTVALGIQQEGKEAADLTLALPVERTRQIRSTCCK